MNECNKFKEESSDNGSGDVNLIITSGTPNLRRVKTGDYIDKRQYQYYNNNGDDNSI
jgi:hypothetical protein